MKKTIAIILTMLVILNSYSPISNATSIDFGKSETIQEEAEGQSIENNNSIMEEGTVTTTNGEGNTNPAVEVKVNPSFLDSATSFLQSIVLILPSLANNIMSLIVYGNMNEVFTIQKLLSNEYAIFDVNFFKTQEDEVQNADAINKIKQSVATWYVSIRNVSAVAIAIVLVYIAIKMAISTVADNKAKYKKMLIFWFESVALLFLLHFFVLMALNISDTINDIMIKQMQNIEETSVGVEEQLINNIRTNLNSVKGATNTLIYLITYTMLIYYEMKFFLMYFMRVLRVGFYIVIAPLVCLTYPIDRLGDGRAQAFKKWFTEITMEIFLQSIHLGLYIVFIFSAGEIINQAPFLGIIFLAALGRGEAIVRGILKVKPRFAKGISETKLPKLG